MKLFKKNKVQIHFLNKVKELIPDNYSFVDELANILELSTDSSYRRIRGETALTINEVAILCKKYNISFDYFTQGDNNVTFSYNIMHDKAGFKRHMESILDALIKIIEPEYKKITYAAIDIPIFYHFKFKELAAFKMFYWMKAVNNVPQLQDIQFDPDLIDPEFIAIGQHIFEIYQKAPSVEIWSDGTINSLVKQIEFFWESGNFKTPEDALLICQQARDELELIAQQANEGKKVSTTGIIEKNDFMLYHSDIEIGNNTIFIERGDVKTVYLTFNTFNALITPNIQFIEEINIWIDNLKKKSTLISATAQKHRYQFFKRAFAKIEALEKKIQDYH